MKKKQYDGYKSFSFLERGPDYQPFELAPEIGRVEPFELDLSDEQRQRVDRLLRDNVVISLHDHPIILPKEIEQTFAFIRAGRQYTAYEALSASALDAVFDNFLNGLASITSSAGWKWEDIIHDVGMRFADLAKQDFVIKASSVGDILQAHETGRLALVPGLEAATPIENELDRIDILYGLGIRQMGIAYSEANALGSGLKEKKDGGLTAFGERAIRRMNKLGIAIDISHSGDRTGVETIAASTKPIFITHSGARALWSSKRLKPDEVIIALAERGGVIGIEAAPLTTVSKRHPRHSIESVMDHFTYCVDLVGIEHVAFGPDTIFGDHVGIHRVFAEALAAREITAADGGERPELVPYVEGLENPAECFPTIVGWLVQHDFSEDEIKAVIGGNILRVVGDVW